MRRQRFKNKASVTLIILFIEQNDKMEPSRAEQKTGEQCKAREAEEWTEFVSRSGCP